MKKYYVYEHWLDGQCFYVGKGTYGSLWGGKERYEQFQSDRRNKDWQNFVKNDFNKIEVKIVENFSSESDAVEFEEQLSIKRKQEGHPITCKLNGRNTSGENNPMFNKNALENKTVYELEIIASKKREKLKGKPCKKNRKTVVLVDSDNKIVKKFDTVHEAINGEWRKQFPKPNSAQKTNLSLKQGLPFHGFYLKYENEYVEELK